MGIENGGHCRRIDVATSCRGIPHGFTPEIQTALACGKQRKFDGVMMARQPVVHVPHVAPVARTMLPGGVHVMGYGAEIGHIPLDRV
jgi:hypothetical protein